MRAFLVGESLMRQAGCRGGDASASCARGGERERRMTRLSHIAEDGSARMVDVSAKPASDRVAVAEGRVRMRAETLALIRAGDAKKGDVLGVARIAGIMASKRTHELIPLCHPLAISGVSLDLALDDACPGIRVTANVRTSGPTGSKWRRSPRSRSPASPSTTW